MGVEPLWALVDPLNVLRWAPYLHQKLVKIPNYCFLLFFELGGHCLGPQQGVSLARYRRAVGPNKNPKC